MADTFNYDVFLSHNQADKPKVRQLAERLRLAGVRVWLDEWVVKPGDIIALKVDEGLEQSRVLVLCISPAALASGWVALERSTAVHRDPSNSGRRFIPLLLAKCVLPDTLAKYKYLDFREESEAAFSELLASCKLETELVQTVPLLEFEKKLATKKLKPSTSPEEYKPLYVLERKLMGHKDWVHAVAISMNGKVLVSGGGTGHGVRLGDDCSVRVWDLDVGKCRFELKGHTERVNSIAISPDGKWFVSSSRDSVRIWETDSGLQSNKLTGAFSVVALQNSTRILISGLGNLRIWDITLNSWVKEIGAKTDQIAINRLGN